MNRLLTILCFILLPAWAWGATYYVSPTGSNTSPYDTWTKAANLPSTAVTAGNTDVGGNGPHVMYVAPGTYNSQIVLNDDDWIGGQVIGTAAVDSTTAATKGQVVLSYATGHGLQISRANISVSNISVTGTNSSYDTLYIGADNFNGDNLHIYGSGRYTVYANNATNLSITNSRFSGAGNVVYPIYLLGTTAGDISYTIIDNGTQGSDSDARARLYITSSGTLNFNNVLILGSYHIALRMNSATGTLNIKNSIISSGFGGDNESLSISNGTVNLYNSMVGMGWIDHEVVAGTLNTDTANIYNLSRNFKRYARDGWVILSVDDAVNWEYAKSLESLFASHGVKGSLYVDAVNAIASANKAGIQALIDGGVFDIEYHGYSHSNMGAANTDPVMTITKAGATITVARAADTITIDPGGTVTEFKAKSLTAIRTELNAMGCTVDFASGVNGNMLGEAMNDIAGASPQSPLHLIDTSCATGLYKAEIADTKTVMQANFTGLSSTIGFATPYGYSSANLQTAVKNAGIHSLRSNLAQVNANWGLTSLNIYGLSYIGTLTIKGATDQDTQNYTHALAQMVADRGGVMSIVSHGADEISAHDWDVIIQVLKQYPEIHIGSMSDFVSHILTSGLWATTDDITYTRTFTDSSDYRLLSSSPCRNAGSNTVWSGTANVTDFSGRKITDAAGAIVAPGGVVDIGAYEFKPTAGRLLMSNPLEVFGWF